MFFVIIGFFSKVLICARTDRIKFFYFFINEKLEKSMARGFSIFSREFGAGGLKMHLSNESNLASGPTFRRSRVTFYNSNQDPKGGGIAGVDVEFFVGLRSL